MAAASISGVGVPMAYALILYIILPDTLILCGSFFIFPLHFDKTAFTRIRHYIFPTNFKHFSDVIDSYTLVL